MSRTVVRDIWTGTHFADPDLAVDLRMSNEYTANYCEENIYKLLLPLSTSLPCPLPDLTVIFISNPSRLIPLWCQKLQHDPSVPVLWDYHVILLHSQSMYDFDSTLPFRCDLRRYIAQTLHPEIQLREEFERMYRVVPGDVYAETFSSDRRHMRREDGEWISPPPVWDVIRNGDCEDNLQRFIDMGLEGEGYGTVLREKEFLEFCKYSLVDEDASRIESMQRKAQ